MAWAYTNKEEGAYQACFSQLPKLIRLGFWHLGSPLMNVAGVVQILHGSAQTDAGSGARPE